MPSMIAIGDNLKTKVIKQLEFYFSDINLRKDNFIKKLAKKDSGWIPTETLVTFNRLKSMINNDLNLFGQILKTLNSDVIELHPNGDKIRRRADRPVPKLDEKLKQIFNEKAVEVKGFPDDTNLDELLEWSQKFGSVLCVKMKRKKKSIDFDGRAVITFAEKEMADNFVNQLDLKYKDMVLTKETKQAQNEKQRKHLASKVADLNDKMKTVSMDTSSQSSEVSAGLEGTVLQLKGLPRKLVSKEKKKDTNQIKEFFSGYGRVVYFTTDSSGNCLIQFIDRSAAQKVLDLNKTTVGTEVVHKLVFNGRDVTARMLSADEEKAFWIRANERKEKKLKVKQINKEKKKRSQSLRKRSNSSVNSAQETKRLAPATA